MESSFFLQIFLQIQHDLRLHFFQSCYAILFGICYNSSPFFCFWIIKEKIYMIDYTPHDLKFTSINNVIIIYNEK
jgi:hypothetical protein